jgi:hypothetical protein
MKEWDTYKPSKEMETCIEEGLWMNSTKLSIRLIELKRPLMNAADFARAGRTLKELRNKK